MYIYVRCIAFFFINFCIFFFSREGESILDRRRVLLEFHEYYPQP